MLKIDIIRKKFLIFKKNNSANLEKKKYNIFLSSLISFRQIIFNDIELDQIIKSQKNFIIFNYKNVINQLKNFLYILNFNKINFYENRLIENIKKYDKIIISWSYKDNFRKKIFIDNYFKNAKNPKDFFWILIHCDDSVPNKIYDNTLVIHPSKGNILNGLIKIFSYFFHNLINSNFNLKKLFHVLSYDSYLAFSLAKYIKKKKLLENINYLHMPLENQPFQNLLINLAKLNKIKTIGYDHTLNPFPFYNSYSSLSPDKIKVHSISSLNFYKKKLLWPSSKVILTPSLRYRKVNFKKEFYNYKIFLPISINDMNFYLNKIEHILKNFIVQKNINLLEVKIHPQNTNNKKFINFKKNINIMQKKYFLKNKKKKQFLNYSIHIGNSSTILEALESGIDVFHISNNVFFDYVSPSFWPTVDFKLLDKGIFYYRMKKFGQCISSSSENLTIKN